MRNLEKEQRLGRKGIENLCIKPTFNYCTIKNGWVDENGRVFIYYSVINICEILNCGTQKACKLLDELETFGALERRRQGLGKPNKLYLKKVF